MNLHIFKPPEYGGEVSEMPSLFGGCIPVAYELGGWIEFICSILYPS
jgi:hypothetical protein